MIEITATDRDGTVHQLSANDGASVMEVMRDAGLPVEAVCGGCCSCATCHVYVDSAWMERAGVRGDDETDLLLMSDHLQADQSRLGCQVTLTPALNGLMVTLAPEE